MPDTSATVTEIGRRGQARGKTSPSVPRFVNRIPGRLPAPLLQAHHATRASQRWAGAFGLRTTQGRGGRAEVAHAVRQKEAAAGSRGASGGLPPKEKGDRMRRPMVKSLETVSLDEALAYLDAANGDELGAAFTLASDRNRLSGESKAPDETEVHHALFLLRRARGLEAPSFDLMRVQLRRRVAA